MKFKKMNTIKREARKVEALRQHTLLASAANDIKRSGLEVVGERPGGAVAEHVCFLFLMRLFSGSRVLWGVLGLSVSFVALRLQ
jgi:hypothetical protein